MVLTNDQTFVERDMGRQNCLCTPLLKPMKYSLAHTSKSADWLALFADHRCPAQLGRCLSWGLKKSTMGASLFSSFCRHTCLAGPDVCSLQLMIPTLHGSMSSGQHSVKSNSSSRKSMMDSWAKATFRQDR
ncbi:hypothetical protein HBI56_007770 [Parastagonospora nodorum]|uniref:Uncharacterized protein n=1 Tax=Phaeosphaeria nodorum (strain SN15 / ATCC MYA-4574 / FGSC 10173) TaxID=321614 RepID=A0A7U2HTB3_PHANO|nr:hypothetical protein HBH56_121940 [Parastagonospora nodorum]QRC91020.1 hypothetical protein JI435_400890 [Parastagonospora nodorum SN15]KAH3934906.1 hypothetical protein HBH54_047490 [Parastagonospora nodorum]KAH3950348.1 hypothetical protein HBH53_076470 [Parastagonospora nodorum]KAH3986849.1 hypothetical protein HBH51_009560 [Parastagonospora nodorum]